MRSRLPARIALVLAAISGIAWTWFGISSGIHACLTAGICFLVLFAAACKWQLAGGVLLIFAAMLMAVTYPWLFAQFTKLQTTAVTLVLVIPPFAAGVLLFVNWWLASAPQRR